MVRLFPDDGEHSPWVVDLSGRDPGVLLQLAKDRLGRGAAPKVGCGATFERDFEETHLLGNQVHFWQAGLGCALLRIGSKGGDSVDHAPDDRGITNSLDCLNEAL